MEVINVKRDQVIARRNDKVNYWYLVQEGTVIQKFEFSEVQLGKNAIVGFLEKDIYLCDYLAGEDTVLAAFTCKNWSDLKNLLAGQERLRNIFLRAAITQRHQLLCVYSDLNNKARQFHMFAESVYDDYINFCSRYRIEEEPFSRMEHFKPLEMQHKAELWEIHASVSITKNYMQEYLQLMAKDDSLTVGVIMEAAAQMHRFALGIGEMESYLSYHKGVLISESRKDLFALFFDLSVKLFAKKHDREPVAKEIQSIAQVAAKLKVYNPRMVARRLNEFKNYDYEGEMPGSGGGAVAGVRKEIDIMSEDCMAHILEYAGYQDDEIDSISEMIKGYFQLPDRMSADSEIYALRRKIAAVYYEIYYKVFLRAVKDEDTLTPVLDMFLNFGFMDMSTVGEEHAQALYELAAHLDVCHSRHVFTIYQWLKCIYRGERDTSKNELDMDYAEYLADMVKTGKITSAQAEDYMKDGEKKVEFEIQNMFSSVNKLTYGKITTFCPVLCGDDLNSDIEKMLVTADRLEEAMNAVRNIDYSIFYREVVFSDVERGINSERIMKEVLPDIILMPNAGTKALLWQEASGKKSDTPGRFMFPIFTMTDVNDMMLDVMGAFRWELCRRIQGVHWNDVRDKSLTAEYCTYIQFYNKNRELSADTKEKIKGALARAKNNYREVFVRDYVNWIRFESKGSYRLNKVAREILARYCPFAKPIRQELQTNPLYQAAFTKFEMEAERNLQRYKTIYDKYSKAGGKITDDLKDNLLFFQR